VQILRLNGSDCTIHGHVEAGGRLQGTCKLKVAVVPLGPSGQGVPRQQNFVRIYMVYCRL
jgi:hypothetical protein